VSFLELGKEVRGIGGLGDEPREIEGKEEPLLRADEQSHSIVCPAQLQRELMVPQQGVLNYQLA